METAIIGAVAFVAGSLITAVFGVFVNKSQVIAERERWRATLRHQSHETAIQRQVESRKKWLSDLSEAVANAYRLSADIQATLILGTNADTQKDQLTGVAAALRLTETIPKFQEYSGSAAMLRAQGTDPTLETMYRELQDGWSAHLNHLRSAIQAQADAINNGDSDAFESASSDVENTSRRYMDRLIAINQRIEFLLAGRDLVRSEVDWV